MYGDRERSTGPRTCRTWRSSVHAFGEAMPLAGSGSKRMLMVGQVAG